MFASSSGGNPAVRRAQPQETEAVADLWLEARRAAIPAIPPPVHSDDAVRDWFRRVVFPRDEVWVIGPPRSPEAMMVLSDEEIDQLYVAPGHQHRGHGTRMVRFAQSRRTKLSLRAFASNTGARRLYERLGFAQDGNPTSDNEEGAPAIRYRWRAR